MHQTRFLGLLQAIPPESGVGNEKIPVLADCLCFAPWSNFWQFFGRREDDAILHLPLDRIAPNSVPWGFARHSTRIKRWKRENTSISRFAWFWCSFGAFSAGTKTTLSWAYPWTELHQTRFQWLLHAIPQESSVGNEKISVLADWPGFGAFLALFWPARRRHCPALTLGMNCTKLGSLGFCRPFHRNLALDTRKYPY